MRLPPFERVFGLDPVSTCTLKLMMRYRSRVVTFEKGQVFVCSLPVVYGSDHRNFTGQ